MRQSNLNRKNSSSQTTKAVNTHPSTISKETTNSIDNTLKRLNPIKTHSLNTFIINNKNQNYTTKLTDRSQYQLHHPETWLGLNRCQCNQRLDKNAIGSVSFAQWLHIPSLGLLLSFKHQICINADIINCKLY